MLFLEIFIGIIIVNIIMVNYSLRSLKKDREKIDEDDSFLAEIFLF